MRTVMIAAAPAVLALCVVDVHAQNQNRGSSPDADRATSQSQATQQRSQATQQRSAQTRFVPQGWIRVWSDYNNDGRYDAVETIYSYDLQRARDQSRARRTGQMPQDGRQSEQAGDQQVRQQTRISGRLTSHRNMELAGERGQEIVVGTIQTDENQTVNVMLGRSRDLSRLDLQDGDQLQIEGAKVRLNDQPHVMARRVTSGDQTVTTSLPQRPNLRKVEGTVANLRRASFRGRDETFLVATVRGREGRQQQVNLGPEQKLTKLDLQQGDAISLLARPGRINGQSASVAVVIRANDQTTVIRSPQSGGQTAAGEASQQRE